MTQFKFYQDRKVTCWERTRFTVAATDYNEAIALIKSKQGEDVLNYEDDKIVTVIDGETLFETTEPLSPKDNGGCPTIETFDETGEQIAPEG